jgi:uncharacterized protein involved in outer membrane biogenesis
MRPRRWITVLLVVVVAIVLIGTIALRLLFPSERIKAEVVERAEAATGFDIALEDARVGLSPRGIAITLDGVGLKNPARLAEDPVLRLSRLQLAVALVPLLSREVRVTHLRLDEPRIFLYRDATGALNAEVARPPGEAPQAAGGGEASQGAGLLLAVPAAEIRHGSFRYVDETSKASYEVGDLDGELRVAFEPDSVRLRTDLRVGGVAADMKAGGGAAYGPLDVALKGEVAHAPASGRTVIRDLVLELEAIELRVNGSIDSAPGGSAEAAESAPHLDLALATGDFEPSRVLSLLGEAAPPGLAVAGKARLSATIRGPAAGPEVAGALILDGVDVTPPEAARPLLTGLGGEASFTGSTLAVKGLRGKLAGSPFTVTASLSDFVRPAVEGKIELSAQLTDLAALAQLPEAMELESGKLVVDVDFSTKAPDFAGALKLNGKLRGDGIGARLPGLAVPVRDLGFAANLAGRRATIEPFSVMLGGSDLGGRVELKSFDEPALDFTLASRHFNLDELLGEEGAAAAADKKAAPVAEGGPTSGEESPPPVMAARGTVRADEFILRGLTARAASLRLTLDRDGLRLDDVRANLLGGALNGSATVSFADPDSLRYSSNLKVTGLDANQALSAMTPAKNLVYGKLDADIDLSGVRAGETPPAALMSALGNASVVDGYLAASGPLATIISVMGLLPDGGAKVDIRQIVAAFEIDRGRVKFRDTQFGTRESGEFTVNGSIGLDGSLDYQVSGLLPKRYAPKQLANQPDLLNLVTDEEGRIPVDFTIGGTVKDPRVALDLKKLEGRAAARAKKELGERTDEEVKKALDEAGKRIGDFFKKK